MPHILAIDTAFAAINLGVLDPQTGHAITETYPTDRGQAADLVPRINEILARARITYDQLSLIVVTLGPGSFTGLRVGIATARGLGLALNIPVQGVLTTDAIRATWAAQGGTGPVQIVLDTRRGDAFAARYAAGQDHIDPTSITIMTTDQALPDLPIMGDGAALWGQPITLPWPDPIVLARLGAAIQNNASHPRHGEVEPFYARAAEVSQSKTAQRRVADSTLVE